ncbi:MAG: rRNA maturation RNase YbeY [Hyphomicrobium sp.]|jgi:probable rRNA maturation factor|nr:rRNA maturation RNase YbeY [Hyphomicrobium sp.]
MSKRVAERRPGRPALLTADVIEDAGDWSFLKDASGLVEAACLQVTAEEDVPAKPASVTIVLSNDQNVSALNGQFRGKPKPTNVLSFPAGAGAEPGNLGDIVIACETLLREAADEDISHEHHFQHLLVHGILHLMGFDHGTDAEAERMEALEIRILARLGIVNPYTAPLDPAKS